jgi:2-dehydro-3-deoxygalactonokinase
MPDFQFAAVDWGTSSFRLWRLAGDGTVLGESRSHEGMIVARENGFADILARHLDAVGASDDLPVLICGMAGAKQGWVEAGYVDVPARLDTISGQAVRLEGVARDIRILPGLAQRDPQAADVMRGEETQLLGCIDHMPGGHAMVAMPGTHSKWVRVEAHRVTRFSTFMTGELFDAISKHTILSHALAASEGFGGDSAVFAAAVRQAFASPATMTSQLFSIRARGLLFSLTAAEAEATLSGLMIGIELAGALGAAPGDNTIILVASGKLAELYRAAFAALGLDCTTIDADQAVRAGLGLAAAAIWNPKQRIPTA